MNTKTLEACKKDNIAIAHPSVRNFFVCRSDFACPSQLNDIQHKRMPFCLKSPAMTLGGGERP